MTPVLRSAAWHAARPAVTVVVPTFDRASLLDGLLAALEAQVDAPPAEVVVVDNGSNDGTWARLQEVVRRTPLPLTAVRLHHNAGPGPARNRGAAEGRAELLAFTDDDCLPQPAWLRAMAAAAADPEVVVVQGRTVPPPGPAPSTWARSMWVDAPTPWFQTCNIAYRRRAFDAAGGFDEDDPVSQRSGGRRAFGEDALLGARVVAAGGRRAFAAEGVVHHRWMPGDYRQHLVERWRVRDFPALVGRLPEVSETLWGGVFLSRRTAEVDLAVVCVLAAAARRRPVLAAGALPWLVGAWGPARARRGRIWVRLGQAALADLVALAALVEGSARHRRPVL